MHAVLATGYDTERSKRRTPRRRLDRPAPVIGKNHVAFMAAV
ncbi:hypothetical protein [Streptomyces yanii]|uniref:Transposase n=1 Tax=Streptomyces yanii TaxID=78510 RepID=A0ABV5RRF4_9ACTN